MDKETKRFMLTVRANLDRAGDMHRLNMAYGKPHDVSEEDWNAAIDARGKHISEQWVGWYKLWKQFGGGNDYTWPL